VKADSHYKLGEDVVLSLPCVISKQGIARQLLVPLNHEEQSLLEKSAIELIDAYNSIL
jgi:L-lactate dehydrogenase